MVDKIISLYEKWGCAEYIGENITQLTHALQCAYVAIHDTRLHSIDDKTRKCVIVATLLHDIGHLIGLENKDMSMMNGSENLGIVGHEGIGASYLEDCGMPDLVCNLVGSHVAVKRYLCTTRNDYYNNLSDASKKTMQLQGGLMNENEIATFEQKPYSQLAILLREYDDNGKVYDTDNDKADDKKRHMNENKNELSELKDYRYLIETVLEYNKK